MHSDNQGGQWKISHLETIFWLLDIMICCWLLQQVLRYSEIELVIQKCWIRVTPLISEMSIKQRIYLVWVNEYPLKTRTNYHSYDMNLAKVCSSMCFFLLFLHFHSFWLTFSPISNSLYLILIAPIVKIKPNSMIFFNFYLRIVIIVQNIICRKCN